MIKTTINLPDELLAALDAIALREGRSRSAVIRDALDEYARARRSALPAWVGMIHDDDGTLTSTNVHEWMHVHRQSM